MPKYRNPSAKKPNSGGGSNRRASTRWLNDPRRKADDDSWDFAGRAFVGPRYNRIQQGNKKP